MAFPTVIPAWDYGQGRKGRQAGPRAERVCGPLPPLHSYLIRFGGVFNRSRFFPVFPGNTRKRENPGNSGSPGFSRKSRLSPPFRGGSRDRENREPVPQAKKFRASIWDDPAYAEHPDVWRGYQRAPDVEAR